MSLSHRNQSIDSGFYVRGILIVKGLIGDIDISDENLDWRKFSPTEFSPIRQLDPIES